MATERRFGPRFGPEAGLIIAAAAFAALLELPWPGVVAVVLAAWLAVAIFEIVRARMRPAAEEPASPPGPQPDIGSEPAERERFAAPPSAHVESPAEPELAHAPEPEPTHPAERPPESPQQQAPSLVAAPEVEPTSASEQERRP